MNCEAFRALLDRVLDGSATQQERRCLAAHEAVCPACAHLHSELDALSSELDHYAANLPPVPATFHSRWTAAIREEQQEVSMENKQDRKTLTRRQWTRMLSVAAALVFVIGGTALTRDHLTGNTLQSAAPAAQYDDVYDSYGWSGSDNGAMLSRTMASAEYTAYTDEDTVEAESASDLSKIIRTASLSVTTRAYDESHSAIRALCEELGGYIASSSERTTGTNALRTLNMELRIPSAQLDAFLSGMSGTGRVTSRSEAMEDVTDSYQDTQSRLATQQALLARLQSLVTDAASLEELLALESQIADTQYAIDRLTQSLLSTDRRVSYATVSLTLREEKPGDAAITQPTFTERLLDALEAGWTAFADFMTDAALFLVASLPFLAVVALIALGVHLARRRIRRGKR